MYPWKICLKFGKKTSITIIKLYIKHRIYHLRTKLTRKIIEGIIKIIDKFLKETDVDYYKQRKLSI